MLKKILSVGTAVVLMLSGAALAQDGPDTLIMEDGRTLTGKILEENASGVKFKMKFATTTSDSSAVIAANAGSRTTAICLISFPPAKSTTETVWLPRLPKPKQSDGGAPGTTRGQAGSRMFRPATHPAVLSET